MRASVIVPTRHEAGFISATLESLLAQDYSKSNMEIIVVDGMSTDGTRDIVADYCRRYPFVKMVDNIMRFTPHAFNVGIGAATGDVIIIVGAHTTYSPNYVSTITKYISENKAECVGSVAVTLPAKDGFWAKYIMAALSNSFGIGNALMRTGVKEPKYVDTASCSGYKKEVFNKIGLFNERLLRHQDIEFNKRLRLSGGRILLTPEINSFYHAKSDIVSVMKYYFRNGYGVVQSFVNSDCLPFSLRHLVPMFFVLSVLFSVALTFYSGLPLYFLLGLYFVAALAVSAKIAVQKHDFSYIVFMPIVFAAIHFSYGVGSLSGILNLISSPRILYQYFKKRCA